MYNYIWVMVMSVAIKDAKKVPQSEQSGPVKSGAAHADVYVSAREVVKNLDNVIYSVLDINEEQIIPREPGFAVYSQEFQKMKKNIEDLNKSSRLDDSDKQSIERELDRTLYSHADIPTEKVREDLLKTIEKMKHDKTYLGAVKRVSEFTEDVKNFTQTFPKAVHDISKLDEAFKTVETIEEDAQETLIKPDGEERVLVRDIKLLNEIALKEEIIDSLLQHLEQHAAEKADVAPETKAAEVNERHESVNEKHGNRQEGGAERNRSSQHKPEEEQALILDIGKLDTPEKIMKQRSIIDANIHKRVDEIHRMLYNMSDKKNADITTGELEKVSDANIKLFVEIGAYKDLLMEMKDNLGRTFPDDKETREAHAKAIDELVEKIGDAGVDSNKKIAQFAEEKEFNVHRVPMFTHEIRDMQKDLYNIKDSSGKPIYERLGANILFYDEGNDSDKIVRQIGEDYEEIMKRLNGKSRAFLKEYEKDYPDMSELVIAQLAAIGVQMKWEGRSTAGREGLWEDANMPFVFASQTAQ